MRRKQTRRLSWTTTIQIYSTSRSSRNTFVPSLDTNTPSPTLFRTQPLHEGISALPNSKRTAQHRGLRAPRLTSAVILPLLCSSRALTRTLIAILILYWSEAYTRSKCPTLFSKARSQHRPPCPRYFPDQITSPATQSQPWKRAPLDYLQRFSGIGTCRRIGPSSWIGSGRVSTRY